MTSLTIPTLLVVLLGVVGRRGYGLALALGGITAAGAAVVVGGIAVPTFYAVAFGAALGLALGVIRSAGPREPLPPAVPLLLALLGWAVFVTCVAPLLFPGLATITPTHVHLEPGVLTSSNVAQLVYLLLGIVVIVMLARDRRTRPSLIGVLVAGGLLLSLWRYGATQSGLPFPIGFFDGSPNLVYIETAAGGVPRFRGIYSEPSALAGTCIVAIAYCASRAWQVRGVHRIGVLLLIILAVFLGVVSTSTTFLVAGVAIVAVAGGTFLFGFLSRTTRLSAILGVAACVLIVVTLLLLPVVADYVQTAVQAKVSGASYEERSGADQDSYLQFIRTFGFGVGLGAGRASSLLPTVLSTVGLPGALLLVAALTGLLVRTAGDPVVRPAAWALVASLTTKAIAGPDLADTTGLVWISLGVLAASAVQGSDGPGLVSDRWAPLAFDKVGDASSETPGPPRSGHRPEYPRVAERGTG